MLIYRQKGNWLNIVIYYENKIINVTAQYICDEKTNYGNLEKFIGEYTKLIDLSKNAKGIYFLEITTNNGVVNKKLILQ